MKTLKPLFIAALLALGPVSAIAAVPSLVNFQGKLLDTTGVPRNGTFSMTFSVWDASTGGTQLWSETQSSVSVANGVFSVLLGSVTPLTESSFGGSTRYLQIQIGAETATARQRLVTSPFAYRAAIADDLVAGDTDYVQNRTTLQTGAAFYVSTGTVNGPLTVGGVITAGTGSNAITTAAGLLDASKLSGTVPVGSLSGTYGGMTAGGLLPGDTDYLQNRDTLQSGASFYVQKGTVGGPFTATGTVTLGGSAGVDDVTVQSNLIVNGAGPHVFAGDLRINGNHLIDSAGTSRVTLGNPIVLNGALDVASPNTTLDTNASLRMTGTANADNFVAFPFTAGGTINAKDVVIISGANTVATSATLRSTSVLGFAVNGASSGNTVWVATSGIVTGVTAGAAITVASRVCTDSSAAGRVVSCTTSGAVIGKALTGTTAAGQTLTVVINTAAN